MIRIVQLERLNVLLRRMMWIILKIQLSVEFPWYERTKNMVLNTKGVSDPKLL